MSLHKPFFLLALGVSFALGQVPEAARAPISDEVKKILLEAREMRVHHRYTDALGRGVSGMRIGIVREGFGLGNSEPDVDEKVRAEIKDKGWPALFGDSGRVYNADGLSLAKGGVTKFIEKLRPFLESQGVKLPAFAEDLRQESYSLLIDGASLPMWTSDDLARELGTEPGITAGLTASRSFALVNKLLEGAGSKERAYAIYSGAALSVMFLTDDLVAVIKADPAAVPKFTPYRLTTDFPFFGQPQ